MKEYICKECGRKCYSAAIEIKNMFSSVCPYCGGEIEDQDAGTGNKIEEINISKDDLINMISGSSSRYGDKLLDFMDQYKLIGLKDASAKQLEEYIEKNNLR